MNFINDFIRFIKLVLSNLFAQIERFDTKYPYTSQNIQITTVYLFALLDLSYSILNNLLSLNFFPESFINNFPFLDNLLNSYWFKIWASPEKVFLITYFVLDVIIIRPPTKISKIIKYNILLVFGILMIQGLLLNIWDLILNREINEQVSKWLSTNHYESGFVGNKDIASLFYIFTFFIFLVIYLFFYYFALRRKIITFNGFHWLTDSIAFWLKIKTPTMFKEKDKGKETISDEE